MVGIHDVPGAAIGSKVAGGELSGLVGITRASHCGEVVLLFSYLLWLVSQMTGSHAERASSSHVRAPKIVPSTGKLCFSVFGPEFL